ncbi:MAG: peptidyl-prolyl cis-trans isomerase [Chthoniobacter sp.]|jgi:cyclophilin family peptidyl-prolyl cis-trans isomerase|nr:peptidyl-prolyl cis-trans isomerase [Chthoniobacter sp.]
MKFFSIAAFALLSLVRLAVADEIAVLNVRVGHEKLERVVLEFYDADAPATVENFKKLARKHFYNGINFHRVFPHSLVQTGDPLSRKRGNSNIGTGGPGYTLPPEVRRRHIEGAVAMSRLPDNINPARRSSGSQFYICLKPMPNLDGQYTVFAHVLEGMEVLEKISVQPADTNDNPTAPVTIKSVKIEPHN